MNQVFRNMADRDWRGSSVAATARLSSPQTPLVPRELMLTSVPCLLPCRRAFATPIRGVVREPTRERSAR
jgi:hypothetical protein